jgi:N-sulfoglucosamine sulfohydrolase
MDPDAYWRKRGENLKENRDGDHEFRRYHGKSWVSILGKSEAEHWDMTFASRTFHEIQMYYPMRAVRDKRHKLIWNIAHDLPYPFASDLWRASSWQAQFRKGMDAPYGARTVGAYVNRLPFELFDIQNDPDETQNLASDPRCYDMLVAYQEKLKDFQERMNDPWILKWEYE